MIFTYQILASERDFSPTGLSSFLISQIFQMLFFQCLLVSGTPFRQEGLCGGVQGRLSPQLGGSEQAELFRLPQLRPGGLFPTVDPCLDQTALHGKTRNIVLHQPAAAQQRQTLAGASEQRPLLPEG